MFTLFVTSRSSLWSPQDTTGLPNHVVTIFLKDYTANVNPVKYAVFACYNFSPLTRTVQCDVIVSVLELAIEIIDVVKTSTDY